MPPRASTSVVHVRAGIDEPLELDARVVRPGRRLGVELHAPDRSAAQAQSLHRPVVQRHVGDVDLGRHAGLGLAHREPVVLARHEHAPRRALEHRVVGAAMPERQLVRLEPERPPHELVAEADAEDRASAVDQPAHLGGVRVHGTGIAGAVRQQHAVGIEREDLGGGRVVADDLDGRARLLEQVHDRRLRAVVDDDDAAAVARGVAVDQAGDGVGERAPGHRRLGREQRARIRLGATVAHGDREHRAAIAQVADERAGVDLGEHDDALRAQPVEHAGAPGGRRVARLVAEQRAHLGARRLLGCGLDAVVADHRGREAEQLAVEARIGERLLVAGHARREDGLADGAGRRTDADRREDRAVREVQGSRSHAATVAFRWATWPAASVSRQRPVTSRPRKALLWLRERRSDSPTT